MPDVLRLAADHLLFLCCIATDRAVSGKHPLTSRRSCCPANLCLFLCTCYSVYVSALRFFRFRMNPPHAAATDPRGAAAGKAESWGVVVTEDLSSGLPCGE